jgi:hypothetical protein
MGFTPMTAIGDQKTQLKLCESKKSVKRPRRKQDLLDTVPGRSYDAHNAIKFLE